MVSATSCSFIPDSISLTSLDVLRVTPLASKQLSWIALQWSFQIRIALSSTRYGWSLYAYDESCSRQWLLSSSITATQQLCRRAGPGPRSYSSRFRPVQKKHWRGAKTIWRSSSFSSCGKVAFLTPYSFYCCFHCLIRYSWRWVFSIRSSYRVT